ncbi:MAG: DJ-1/PfpI family protein [Myxococcales bacterium]|nr:DJ-1/PfpI family protein [Myxococcales bacterium]
MSRVCVLLAPGFEEIEAITIVDVLRRADVEVEVLGVEARRVVGAHAIAVEADARLVDRAGEAWDMVVLPGGMPGSKHLRDSAAVQALLRAQHARGGRLAAICAAPIALSAAGVLAGRRATSYPAFAAELACASYETAPVVVDGPIVTSRGPATALAFALRLVTELAGAETARSLSQAMLVPAD